MKGRTPAKKTVNKKPKKDCEEYRQRRDRNNEAVKKSRESGKIKKRQTIERIKLLREENEALEDRITTLSRELSVLRELLLSSTSRGPGGAIATVSDCSSSPVITLNVGSQRSDTAIIAGVDNDHKYTEAVRSRARMTEG